MQAQEYVRTLSVIVPVLNERAGLENLTQHLSSLNAEQTIIVDGGSSDGGAEWLSQNWQNAAMGRLLLQSAPGRARQMNAGSAYAECDLLLFLHADSRLPARAKEEVLQARERQSLWGRFDVTFKRSKSESNGVGGGHHFGMNVIALFMNIRSRLSSIATGDQAIFVDHVLFKTIGGYPDQPLMEDIAISKTLKRHCVPYCSYLKVETSSRRWERNGLLRTVFRMWYFRLAYFCGASPHRLAQKYQNIR